MEIAFNAKLSTKVVSMKTIKNVCLSSAVALALAGSALVAEESGGFVGVGVGYGGFQFNEDEKLDLNGISYEVIAGYKQFFTPNFGLRYYINFTTYADTSVKVKGTSEKLKASVADYGVNVDVLYNLIASANANFGAFVGVGVGANTWYGGDLYLKDYEQTGLNVALNAGLRSQFGRHHSIEIAARVPFIDTKLQNVYQPALKITASHIYNAGVRYIFSF
nr:outer membrane beta-barrel protein [uncultured Helicobacter sp.]